MMVSRLRPNWEIASYILLAFIALGMRLWELGSRAIHHDESLHAVYSWYLASGQGYQHMPMMHGPFQFHGTALNFFLFGDSDFTARLLPALFGTALVLLPYFLRRHLGRWGSLAVATLLAFSPMLLYFSRFARNDIYILFWTLLLVICLWRYIEEKKARYLYIGAAALSLGFCTKEVSYITVVIFALFLLIVAAWELVSRVRKRLDLKELSAPADFLILIGTLSLPLFCAFWWAAYTNLDSGWEKVLIVLVLSGVCILFGICAVVGILWNWRRLLFSAIIFYGIFTLLYTSFFTNLEGFASGIWGSVDYWVEQQEVARGGQPWYYYILLLSFYEFLPLVFAFIAAIYYTVRGNLFSRFLVYWAALSLIIYSFSGEKMPWLSLHIALPMILLGGMFIGRLLQGFEWRWVKPRIAQVSTVLVLLLLFSFTVHIACQESYQRVDEPPQMVVYAGISSDVPQIMGQIEGLAGETGEGKELRITVDSALTWPWVWYLRDYKIDYPDLSTIDRPPAGTVLLLSAGNEEAARPYLGEYGEGQGFRQLLWFPEEYRGLHIFSSDSWRWCWDYFMHRKTLGPYWSTEGIAYFPRSAP